MSQNLSFFFFCTFHIDAQHRLMTHAVQHSHIRLKSFVFVSIFTTRMVLSAQELFAIEKMATAGMDNTKIATALACRSQRRSDASFLSPHTCTHTHTTSTTTTRRNTTHAHHTPHTTHRNTTHTTHHTPHTATPYHTHTHTTTTPPSHTTTPRENLVIRVFG